MQSAGQSTIVTGMPPNSAIGIAAGSCGVAISPTRFVQGDSFAIAKQSPIGGFGNSAFGRVSCLGAFGCRGSGGAGRPGGAGSSSGATPPPGSKDDSRAPMNTKKYLDMTKTAEGELMLMFSAIAERKEGLEWMEMVRLGIAGDNRFAALVDRPLVKALVKLTSSVMSPEIDNFTSEKRTPWGGTLIAEKMKDGLQKWPAGKAVGESWEISGHSAFPNKFKVSYAGKEFPVSITILAKMFSENLFGKKAQLNRTLEMPYLVKLLNSGGWDEFILELGRLLSEFDERKGGDLWRKVVKAQSSLLEICGRDYDQMHRDISALEKLMIEPLLHVSEKHPSAGSWRRELGVSDIRDIVRMPPSICARTLARLAKIQGESGFTNFIWDIRWSVNLMRLHMQMLARNLSVQVHPTSDYKGLKEGEHSKTEAWIVLAAEEGAGIYLGLKEEVTREVLADALAEGIDLTRYLNFVPVREGDVYFISAGTIHAIGAGVMLVEPQETSETTYRVYDYGRTDDKGNPRLLHVDQAMAVTDWTAPRGGAAVAAMRREPKEISRAGGVLVERLIDESVFGVDRVTLESGKDYHGDPQGIEGFTVVEGAVRIERVRDSEPQGEFRKGQSFLVPAAAGHYSIKGISERSVLIKTTEAG